MVGNPSRARNASTCRVQTFAQAHLRAYFGLAWRTRSWLGKLAVTAPACSSFSMVKPSSMRMLAKLKVGGCGATPQTGFSADLPGWGRAKTCVPNNMSCQVPKQQDTPAFVGQTCGNGTPLLCMFMALDGGYELLKLEYKHHLFRKRTTTTENETSSFATLSNAIMPRAPAREQCH